jgi:hypothetical protein
VKAPLRAQRRPGRDASLVELLDVLGGLLAWNPKRRPLPSGAGAGNLG